MRKTLDQLSAWVSQMRGKERDCEDMHRHRLLEPPSREDVIHAFRLILGREPEDDSAINAHLHIPTVAELRLALLRCEEFRGKYQVMNPVVSDDPTLSRKRDTLVFIHLQKTGGTSLRVMLEEKFPANRRCPVFENKLHLLSASELSQYDFFSGHFDTMSLHYIPRDEIRTIVMFREPRARLISLYRFLRSHPAGDEFAHDQLVRIANETTVEEFFEHPESRALSVVYNHYLVALGTSYARFDYQRSLLTNEELSRALSRAKARIRSLTALGITERFEQSVGYICKALNFDPPRTIAREHVTDHFADMDGRFRRVDPVATTPRLDAALAVLTEYDDELYRCAVDEFERRCAELGISGSSTSAGDSAQARGNT